MPTDHRATLARIKRFDQLIAYLRDELDWPIARDSFEDVDELFYDFTAEELGIDPKTAVKIESIKRLRPLSANQPWGIFFVKFEPKRLPVVALRRILSQVVLKRRATAKAADRVAWAADDLLFVSNYGEGDQRQISFAHFSQAEAHHDLPTLKVLGWDNLDTPLHLDDVAGKLTTYLSWPDDEGDAEAWRKRWRSAFTLRYREAITTSRDLSIRLAELARAIRDRIKTALAIETERGPLTKLMKAFQEALVHDLDADGFADMYAQTIAYGLLSARIADPHSKTADDLAAHMRTNPFLRELMQTFLHIGGRRDRAGGPGIDFDELGVSEVVELLDDANMEAVVRDFGDRNPQEDPVIHFYELFLKEYDARKRMQRGVFYTPRPVVSYIVRSVDELLRTEFDLVDGLADTTTWGEMAKRHKDLKIPDSVSPNQAFVQILDPATGTGTFLVEAIDLIHRTLTTKWKAQGHREKEIEVLWNEYVPKHLLPRLHGYELLMAPYAIAHLKIGLKLHETAYRFASDERARVYLTNALEPAHDFSGRFEFAIPVLAHEAQAVNEIKREHSFTVVVGNPPYSGHSSNKGAWISGLLHGEDLTTGRRAPDYFEIDGQPLRERQPKWLNDDYVKFVRFAQWRIEATGYGIAAFITNHGYIDNPTFRGMRQSLSRSFSQTWVLDLHGNSKKRERSPEGGVDENVFDIQQGVAIGLFVRSPIGRRDAQVRFADAWGARPAKYAWLLGKDARTTPWRPVPLRSPTYAFRPSASLYEDEYLSGIALTDLFNVRSIGVQSHRDSFVVAFDASTLRARIADYCDASCSDKRITAVYGLNDSGTWSLSTSRRAVAGRMKELVSSIVRCLYRPYDQRWMIYHDAVVERRLYSVVGNMLMPNVCLLVGRQTKEDFAALCTQLPVGQHKITSVYDGSYVFPLYVYPEISGSMENGRRPNLQRIAIAQFERALDLEFAEDDTTGEPALTPDDLFQYCYAILHAPTYRARYQSLLKLDFPRIPIAHDCSAFRMLARLGDELTALHLMESPKLDHFITTYTGPKSPEVGRVGWSDGTVWLDAAATKRGQPATPGTIGFRGVREAVWNFCIGGYQVCEKWLKDRKGRALSADDIAHYQKIVVALAETIRLMKEIDEVIEQHGGWPGAFQTGEAHPMEPEERFLKVAEPEAIYGPDKNKGKK